MFSPTTDSGGIHISVPESFCEVNRDIRSMQAQAIPRFASSMDCIEEDCPLTGGDDELAAFDSDLADL